MSSPHGWMWAEGTKEQALAWDPDLVRQAGNRFPDLTRFPSKADLREAGPESLLKGWLPPQPLILPGSRVVALGSCFAAHFIEWLATNGYNQTEDGALVSLMRNAFENVAVIAQQFRWAFGEAQPPSLLWIGKDKTPNAPSEETRLAMRRALVEADVFIATLSMSDLWYHKPSGEPLWRLMPPHVVDLDQYAFKVMSVAEIVGELQAIERIRAKWLPKTRIIYTVSPLPMAATYRPVSPISANAASKASVRAALDEFLRARGDDLNRIYFYFPAYELVNALPADPFLQDNRHLQDGVIDMVLDLFARTYTQAGREASQGGAPLRWPEVSAEGAYIADLEARNAELQRVCDERLRLIEELKQVCDERLQAIDGLKHVCDERLALIEQLHRGPQTAIHAREEDKDREDRADAQSRHLQTRMAILEARVQALGHAFSRGRQQARRNWLRPPLWVYEQHGARELSVSPAYRDEAAPADAPSIAIVTPTLNRRKYLQATIDSVVTQAYPRLTYRVQDGGSTDETLDLLRSYGSQITWRSEPDSGQAEAINRAFADCGGGEIMAYLNSDDVLLPGTLAYVARAFQERPDVDVVYGHRIFIDAAGREIGRAVLPPHDRRAIYWSDYIPQETMFWRRRVWTKVGPFNETLQYALDWDFIIRAQQAGLRFLRLPRFLACFRVHDEQKVAMIYDRGYEEMQALRRRSLGYQPSHAAVVANMMPYLLRQLAIHWMYRGRMLRY